MKKLYKYIITISIGLVLAFLVATLKDIFNQQTKQDVFHVLSDAFFVPGVVITGVGALMFVSNEGSFDGITYALLSFIKMFGYKKDEKLKSYKDYKDEKHTKKTPIGFILISGLILIAMSVIMLIIYYNV